MFDHMLCRTRSLPCSNNMAKINCKACNEELDSMVDAHKHICLSKNKAKWGSPGTTRNSIQNYTKNQLKINAETIRHYALIQEQKSIEVRKGVIINFKGGRIEDN